MGFVNGVVVVSACVPSSPTAPLWGNRVGIGASPHTLSGRVGAGALSPAQRLTDLPSTPTTEWVSERAVPMVVMSSHMGSWMLVESGVVSKVWLCWRGCPPPPKRLTALPSTHPTWWVSNRAAPFTEWAVYSHALLQRHARLASH